MANNARAGRQYRGGPVIAAAAVRYMGKICAAKTHDDAHYKLWDSAIWDYEDGARNVPADDQGFLTHDGQFVDRSRAGAIAFDSGQTERRHEYLFSQYILWWPDEDRFRGIDMGIRAFSDGRVSAPNPDPAKFKILETTTIGAYVVATIQYPGCTTFEGKKIAVYETTEEELRSRVTLDPHFTDSPGCPVARFPGNELGACFARMFARKVMRDRA